MAIRPELRGELLKLPADERQELADGNLSGADVRRCSPASPGLRAIPRVPQTCYPSGMIVVRKLHAPSMRLLSGWSVNKTWYI